MILYAILLAMSSKHAAILKPYANPEACDLQSCQSCRDPYLLEIGKFEEPALTVL
jgi:hypothetical protein